MNMRWMGSAGSDRVQFPITTFAPRQARTWIAEADRVGPERLDIVLLLLSELVTNSVRHSGAGPAEQVEVRMAREGTVLRVEVQDPGPGFVRPRTMGPGPHGLQIVDAESDRWGVQRSPTIVWFEIDVQEERGHGGQEGEVRHPVRLFPRDRRVI
jgi:two-component sensor histidine kinase